LTLGVSWGALVGGTAELIFSVLNPFGSGLVFPPLLMSQVFSMIIIGAAGGLMCPVFFKRKFSTKRIASLAITGFVLTFIFDSLTTLSYPLSAGFDWPQTSAPQLTPSVRPAKKTITVINSTFGTINNENPKPIANAVKIEARTNLFRSIVLTC
ncbi:hypothetical protein ACFL0J_08670, partial [Candidatus Neomarinimicrobiota bacterium]